MPFSSKDKASICIDAVAILIGDYPILQKKAALLLLKALLPDSVVKSILTEDEVYPFDRNDPRVKEWTRQVLLRGKCAVCGATEHLEAHHIIKWADYPKGRIDINNGECLCHECHTKAHCGENVYHMMASKYKED
jgi:hypothetical protein